ncbi:hypothetical protein BJ138DRAFT_1164338 [Hygrophoropsis aurantiaca]|uniref:Uncharacterized protein n=1 Tax=Hygrophoropsis aurantiaca TaxID=72124 RepID=A0ACB7ZXI6_9AGAM|nr:hypothetical protein BJ138DRAFT_1164338 [Hygrophoropsis aurantiaca]
MIRKPGCLQSGYLKRVPVSCRRRWSFMSSLYRCQRTCSQIVSQLFHAQEDMIRYISRCGTDGARQRRSSQNVSPFEVACPLWSSETLLKYPYIDNWRILAVALPETKSSSAELIFAQFFVVRGDDFGKLCIGKSRKKPLSKDMRRLCVFSTSKRNDRDVPFAISAGSSLTVIVSQIDAIELELIVSCILWHAWRDRACLRRAHLCIYV